MIKHRSVLILGIWLIFIDFLGIPKDWKIWLYVLTGLALVISYIVRFGRNAVYETLRSYNKQDRHIESDLHNEASATVVVGDDVTTSKK